jgi:hypothetical protein
VVFSVVRQIDFEFVLEVRGDIEKFFIACAERV